MGRFIYHTKVNCNRNIECSGCAQSIKLRFRRLSPRYLVQWCFTISQTVVSNTAVVCGLIINMLWNLWGPRRYRAPLFRRYFRKIILFIRWLKGDFEVTGLSGCVHRTAPIRATHLSFCKIQVRMLNSSHAFRGKKTGRVRPFIQF